MTKSLIALPFTTPPFNRTLQHSALSIQTNQEKTMRPLQYGHKKTQVPDDGIEKEIYSMLSHLCDLAWCAIQESKSSKQEVFVFCIELCTLWADLASQLANPNYLSKTKVVTDTGNERFISGLGDHGFSLLAIELAHGIEERLSIPPNDGVARLLVFYSEGIMTMDLVPTHTQGVC